MDATISALLKDVVSNLEPLKNLNEPYIFSPQFWTLVASSLIALVSSLIALLIAGGVGRYVKPRIGIKPKIELLAFKRFRQANHYWRLVIKNSGREVASRVQVDVVNIFDDGKERENFLAIPLRWTHLNCESRDILPEQTVYLDVIEHFTSSGGDKAKLITRFGGGVDDFEILKNGRTKLVLDIYEENGKVFNKTIEISWANGLFFDGKLEGKKWLLTKDGEFIHS